MTIALRAALGLFDGLLLLGAVALAAAGLVPLAVYAGGFGALLLIGLACERWRYQKLAGRPPGPGWVATDERFIDPETGRLVTVYHYPPTGERRYVAP